MEGRRRLAIPVLCFINGGLAMTLLSTYGTLGASVHCQQGHPRDYIQVMSILNSAQDDFEMGLKWGAAMCPAGDHVFVVNKRNMVQQGIGRGTRRGPPREPLRSCGLGAPRN